MSAFTCRDQRTTSALIPSRILSFHLPHFVRGSVIGLEFADLAGLVGLSLPLQHLVCKHKLPCLGFGFVLFVVAWLLGFGVGLFLFCQLWVSDCGPPACAARALLLSHLPPCPALVKIHRLCSRLPSSSLISLQLRLRGLFLCFFLSFSLFLSKWLWVVLTIKSASLRCRARVRCQLS